jgi:hypothetical protein
VPQACIKSRGASGLFVQRAAAPQLVSKTHPKAKGLCPVLSLEDPGFFVRGCG